MVNKAKTEYFYKVTSYDLKSVNLPYIDYNSPSRAVQYVVGEWVTHHKKANPFLFVFKDLQSAKGLLSNFRRDNRVFKCEVKNPTTKKRYKQLLNYDGVPVDWNRIIDVTANDWGKGVLICDAVKLIEEIK